MLAQEYLPRNLAKKPNVHRLLVDVLNVPSRAQRASAGSPIGHVMAASKSIALAPVSYTHLRAHET